MSARCNRKSHCSDDSSSTNAVNALNTNALNTEFARPEIKKFSIIPTTKNYSIKSIKKIAYLRKYLRYIFSCTDRGIRARSGTTNAGERNEAEPRGPCDESAVGEISDVSTVRENYLVELWIPDVIESSNEAGADGIAGATLPKLIPLEAGHVGAGICFWWLTPGVVDPARARCRRSGLAVAANPANGTGGYVFN